MNIKLKTCVLILAAITLFSNCKKESSDDPKSSIVGKWYITQTITSVYLKDEIKVDKHVAKNFDKFDFYEFTKEKRFTSFKNGIVVSYRFDNSVSIINRNEIPNAYVKNEIGLSYSIDDEGSEITTTGFNGFIFKSKVLKLSKSELIIEEEDNDKSIFNQPWKTIIQITFKK